ncbi:MAG: DUF427 domain-containing protein [Bacteriovoracia bacterium]
MMSPGYTEDPEHRITTERMRERVEIFMEGEKIAETRRAIKLSESGYPDRYYIPREDIRGIELIKFRDYECPFKGQGELYSVKHGASRFENAAWSYSRPYDDMTEIKNLIAFYPEKVQLIRVTG